MWRIRLADEVFEVRWAPVATASLSMAALTPANVSLGVTGERSAAALTILGERVKSALSWFEPTVAAATVTIDLKVSPAEVVPFTVTLTELADQQFHLSARGHYEAQCDRGVVTLRLADDSSEAIGFALRNAIKQIFLVRLVQRGGVALHAASVVHQDQAFVFFGPSGVGKTTLCRAYDETLVLNDELTVITPDRVAHRTPYFGELGVLPGVLQAPVQRMFLLDQGAEQGVVKLSPSESVRALLRHAAWFSGAPIATRKLTSTCVELAERFFAGRLVTPKLEAQTLKRLWSTPGFIV